MRNSFYQKCRAAKSERKRAAGTPRLIEYLWRIQLCMGELDYIQEMIEVAALAQTQGLFNPDPLDFPACSVQVQCRLIIVHWILC